MNNRHEHYNSQPLSPKDLLQIRALLRLSNVGLAERCVRHRHRMALLRHTFAACVLVVTTIAFYIHIPQPEYAHLTSNQKVAKTYISQTINEMMPKS